MRTRPLAFSFLILASIQSIYSSQALGKELVRVGVAEWLPLHAHRQVMEAVKENLQDTSNAEMPVFEFVPIQAYGDEDDLRRELDAATAQGCTQFIAFGNYVTSETVQTIPDLDVIGVLIRDATSFAQSVEEHKTRITIIDSDPPASMIWELGNKVFPDMETLGLLYTQNFGPNESLVRRLQAYAEVVGGSVYSATVGEGNCRTESDFQKALDLIPQSQDVDVLFVPDDPNVSRFIRSVIQLARSKGWKITTCTGINSEDVVGSLSLNYSTLANRVIASLMDNSTRKSAAKQVIESSVYEMKIN